MLYVGIDQHARHLTVCARDEQGDIVLRRQVSTSWYELDRFLHALQARSEGEGGYVALMEVCGFNGWLIQRLRQHGCVRVCVITAPPRLRQKTDRRDAGKLSELLWSNRNRIAGGDRLVNVSEVYQPTADEGQDRQLTHLRWRLGQEQTRVKNRIKGILRRHNLQQECPTKGVFTQAGLRWLKTVALPEMDRVELDMRLEEYLLHTRHLQRVNGWIIQRARRDSRVPLLRTVAKIGEYTALALSSHIGPIGRFRHARSLANFFGVTPGSRSSGETERMGSITKAGHPLIRFLLGQMVLNGLRSDPGLRRWYQRIKRKRGCKIARVAVMRRLCEAIWHMLSKQVRYRPVGPPPAPETSGSSPRAA
jgi:transposase